MMEMEKFLRNGGNSRVVVEPIEYDVDSELIAETIERTMSSNLDMAPTTSWNEEIDYGSVARKWIAEIKAGERMEIDVRENDLITAQNRQRSVVRFESTPNYFPATTKKNAQKWNGIPVKEQRSLVKQAAVGPSVSVLKRERESKRASILKKNRTTATTKLTTVIQEQEERNGKESVQKERPRAMEMETNSVKYPPEKTTNVVDPMRLKFRKEFRDILCARAKDSDDILLTNAEIRNLVLILEQEVYKSKIDPNGSYGGTTYKQQCQYLLFNFRNPNNHGFFRRVLTGELSIARAAVFSPSKMSSIEMSRWGNRVQGNGIVRKNGTNCKDTTAQHKAHLFDLNCKICMEPEPEGNAVMKEAKVRKLDKSGPNSASRSNGAITNKDGVGGDNSTMVSSLQTADQLIYSSSPSTSRSDLSPLSLCSKTSSSSSNRYNQVMNGGSNFKPDTLDRPSSTCSAQSSTSSKKSEFNINRPPPINQQHAPILINRSIISNNRSSSSICNNRPLNGEWRAPASSKMSSPFWRGLLYKQKIFKLRADLTPVNGRCWLLADLPQSMEVSQRVKPEMVYEYLGKIWKIPDKYEVIIFRVVRASGKEDMREWDSFYEDMAKKKRMGVVELEDRSVVKDFYFMPLDENEVPHASLLPFKDGPGLEHPRQRSILGIVVRHCGEHTTSDTMNGKKSNNLAEIYKYSVNKPDGSQLESGSISSTPSLHQDQDQSPMETNLNNSLGDLNDIKLDNLPMPSAQTLANLLDGLSNSDLTRLANQLFSA